jgi:glycosyltransferase involved in cell wall biosynthesis
MLPIMNKSENIFAEILLLSDKNNVFYNSLTRNKIKVSVIKYNNMYDFRNIFEINKFIKNGKFDIVHSHLFPSQYWLALSRISVFKNKAKFITTEHSTNNRRRNKWYFKYVDKFVYAKYDVIVSISNDTEKSLINWIGSKNIYKHLVIENGLDIEQIINSKSINKNQIIKGISEKIKLICMVGRFSEQKDQPTLIRAMNLLEENIHLILIGEGNLMTKNIDLSVSLGLNNRVHFLGFREDVYSLISSVDLIVLSSNWEGFGLAALEGMALGKPVIASNVEGLRNLIDDEYLLFQPGDYHELSLKINLLLSNKTLYRLKSDSAYKKSKEYDIHLKLKELINVYERLIK